MARRRQRLVLGQPYNEAEAPRDLQVVQQTSEAYEEGPVIKMQHMNREFRHPKFTQSKM